MQPGYGIGHSAAEGQVAGFQPHIRQSKLSQIIDIVPGYRFQADAGNIEFAPLLKKIETGLFFQVCKFCFSGKRLGDLLDRKGDLPGNAVGRCRGLVIAVILPGIHIVDNFLIGAGG